MAQEWDEHGTPITHQEWDEKGNLIGGGGTTTPAVATMQQQQPPGFFHRLGQSLGLPTSMAEMKPPDVNSNSGVAESILGPIVPAAQGAYEYGKRALSSIGQGANEEVEAAKNIAHGGPVGANLGKAAYGMVQGGVGALPFVGEPTMTAGQDIANKNYAGAAGGLTGVAGQLGLMGAGRNPESLAEKGTENVGKGLGVPTSPEAQSLTKMRGAPKELQGTNNIEVAKKDLAQIAKTVPIEAKGANASFAHAKAMVDYAKNLWETEHQGPIARNINTPIDSSALVNKAQAVMTPEAIGSDPGNVAVARRMNSWLTNTIAQPRSLGSADTLLREINADLEANPQSAKPYGQLQVRVKQAVQQELRNQIDTTLQNAGETGVRDVNKRYGALRDLADRAIQQGIAEARSSAKAGPIPEWVHGYVFQHVGGMPSVGAGLNPAKLFGSSAGNSLSKGMKQLGSSEALPRPPIPLPPSTTSTTSEGNPASGLVKQEFSKIGISDLVSPRQQTTLETMFRGPQWKDMDRAEKVAAVRDILNRK